MSTTDILFNSPALHSLKRAQLVQLCKRHNVKASGKNTELVSRLKEHARRLPSSTPLSIAVRSEAEPDSFGDGHSAESNGNDDVGMMTDISDEDNVEEQLTSPEKERDSQVWEIVSRGSLDSKRSVNTTAIRNQAGDSGLTTNSKTTILRSIASSIGLALSPSNNSIPLGESSDSLASNTDKKDIDLSSSPRAKSIFSSLMPRNRSNSHESQTKAKEDARKSFISNAIPYNKIPMPSISRRPQIEPFAFSYTGPEDISLNSDVSMASLDRPVPGVGPCFSTNANDGAGTIRLITSTNKPPGIVEEGPKLTPVVPAFDLIPPTPGKTGLHRFPASDTPQINRTLYPIITADDMSVDLESLASPSRKPSKVGMDKSLPGLPDLSPVSPTSPRDPFIFGSPNPRHSTTPADFSNAATNVLAEMNARLGAAGGRTVDANVLAHVPGTRAEHDVEALLKYEFGSSSKKDEKDDEKNRKKEGSLSKKFDKLHEKAFSKMDGIDSHYAAKRVMKGKEQNKEEEKLEPLPENRKRKQSVLNIRKSTAATSTKKVKGTDKAATKKKTEGVKIPGAFEAADDMDVDESMTRTEVSGEYEEYEDHQVNEENDRGAKRACVEEPVAGGSGETRRISIVPKVHKDIGGDEEEMDEEKKRKQSEAIKRRLELNKARRRSSRGRVSMAARSPQKQKGFLASAKSFVKSVWNRGANTPIARNNSGPSYLRATASSASKGHEQDKASVPAVAMKQPIVSRVPSVRASNVGTGTISRKPSISQKQQQNDTGSTPASGLETVTEGEGDGLKAARGPASPTQVGNPQNSRAAAPIFGSTKTRKPSTAASLARSPSGSGAPIIASAASASRSSRLLAPTASSLAKTNTSPTKASTLAGTNVVRAKVPSVRAHGSVVSPSKIPVFSPPQRKNQRCAAGSSTKRIFRSPLVLPSSPQARSAAERGQVINPITGAVNPQRLRLPFSSVNGQPQSLMSAATAMKEDANTVVTATTGTDKGKEINAQIESPRKINKALNSLRKPRLSRTKVTSRLGSRAAAPGTPRIPNSPTKATSSPSASRVAGTSKAPTTPKVRSSTAVAVRRSLGGRKARESTGDAVVLSAKKRARTTEYARRKSARSPIRKPDFSQAGRNGGDAMEVDA